MLFHSSSGKDRTGTVAYILGFTGAAYAGYTDGDGHEKSLVAPKNGAKQFYRLVVEDVKQGD